MRKGCRGSRRSGDFVSDFIQEKGTGELPSPAIMFPAMTGRDRSEEIKMENVKK